MRALVYADLQAGESSQRLFSAPTVSLQLYRVKKFFNDVVKLARDKGCDMIWDLGDTTDDRNAIPITVVDAVLEGIDALPVHEAGSIKLIGNHEQWLRNGTLHVGRLFDRKFNIVDKLCSVDITSRLTLVCAAFPADDAELATCLKAAIERTLKRKRDCVVLGHFQVVGCQLNSGQASTGIPASVLKGAKLSLLGHVHRFQQVAPASFYVGSPFQQDFGEAHDPEKRVAVVDLDTLEVEWINLPGFPLYRTVDFETFDRLAVADSEDRFQVTLASHAETERFYAHPLSARAEPIYRYTETGVSNGSTETDVDSWTLERAMSEYVRQASGLLKERNISISSDDLVKFGAEIVAGQ